MPSQYRRISATLWSSTSFLDLPEMQPSARGLMLYLLTTGETGYLPGVHRVGVGGLADVLGWSLDDTARCLDELEAAGLAVTDRRRRLVWIPQAIAGMTPTNARHLAGWQSEWERVPACELRNRIAAAFKAALIAAERDPKVLELWEQMTRGDTLSDSLSPSLPETRQATSDSRQATSDKRAFSLRAPVLPVIDLADALDDEPPPADPPPKPPPTAADQRWQLAERLISEHPPDRLDPAVDVVQALAVVPLDDVPTLETNHAAWLKSERWREESGRFVPGLAKWIRSKRWQKPPPTGAQPPPPATDAERLADTERRLQAAAERREREAREMRGLRSVA